MSSSVSFVSSAYLWKHAFQKTANAVTLTWCEASPAARAIRYRRGIDSQAKQQKRQPIASLVTRDGTLVEMLYDQEAGNTSLVTFHRGRLRGEPSLEVQGLGRAIPYSPLNNLLTHGVVLFPSAASEFGNTGDLVNQIASFIHKYADLSPAFEEAAALYVLLTWVYDAFSEIPYLRLKGDFGSGKTRCLLAIGSLCYKPMFVSGASTVSPMFRIIDAFRGTLILDESDFRFSDEKAEIIKILNNGNAVGFPVLRSEITPTKEFNPRAFVVFGPKIIASRADFDDRALESRCITEAMAGLPPRADIPLSLPSTFHDEARELRNKLLMYRFLNFHSSRELTLGRSPSIEARVAQVFAPLLAVTEDPEARQRLIRIARGHTSALRAERSASVEAQILEVMAGMKGEGLSWTVKAIAERFASQFSSDFDRPITPRWIGAQLRRRLSLVPLRISGTFVVPKSADKHVSALLARYGLLGNTGDVGTSETI